MVASEVNAYVVQHVIVLAPEEQLELMNCVQVAASIRSTLLLHVRLSYHSRDVHRQYCSLASSHRVCVVGLCVTVFICSYMFCSRRAYELQTLDDCQG